MTLRIEKICIFVLLLLSVLIGNCKQKSSKPAAPKETTVSDADKQKQDELAKRSSQSTQTPKTMSLGGKLPNDTVVVSSADLTALGGLEIALTGFTSSNVIVGILAGPASLSITSQNSASSRLSGSLPLNVSTSIPVTLLARDLQACSGSDCAIRPNAQGIFGAQQITPNPSYDVQATFNLEVQSTLQNLPPIDGTTPNQPGGTTPPNANSWYDRFKNFLASPMTSFKSGATSVYEYFRNLFTPNSQSTP